MLDCDTLHPFEQLVAIVHKGHPDAAAVERCTGDAGVDVDLLDLHVVHISDERGVVHDGGAHLQLLNQLQDSCQRVVGFVGVADFPGLFC